MDKCRVCGKGIRQRKEISKLLKAGAMVKWQYELYSTHMCAACAYKTYTDYQYGGHMIAHPEETENRFWVKETNDKLLAM